MNLSLETLDPLARLILQALLNSLWQGLLIVVLVWLLLRAIGQASATTRHAVWLVSLLTIGLLPALALTFSQKAQPPSAAPAAVVSAPPEKAVALPERRDELTPLNSPVRYFAVLVAPSKEALAVVSAASAVATPTPVGSDKPISATSAHLNELPVAGQSRAALSGGFSSRLLSLPGQFVVRFLNGRAPFLLAAAWLLVCLLLGWRIAHSYFFLFRLRRQLAAVSPDLSERLQRLTARFGIERQVGLFTAVGVKMPMTIGWLRPLIVLPPDLLESLSTAECDSVIAHELAHIKRWDYATNFLQRILQALFFFHPAVWFINKQLVIERELACDDWAIKLTGEPRRYASCLAKLVELLSESKPLAAATGILFGKHIISRRVEMILNRDRNATTSVSKPALIYAIGLAVLFVFAFSTLSPVIAVPLAQKPAKRKAPEPKPAQPRTPSIAPAVPALPAEAQVLIPEPDEFAPLPPIIAGSEVMELRASSPLATLPEQLVGEGLTSLQDWERTPPLAPLGTTAPLAPGVSISTPFPPGAVTIAPLADGVGWGQAAQAGSSNKTPTIPETELLNLLSDIVKRDADANVRREALQGIYRMRTDAAINTLIQLYDAVTDVKLKSEILSYLMRRNGDNSKAIAKLVQIAKNEKNEELLGRALSQLAYVKGDEGADHLIQIYDGLQDAKLKQRVIRSLAYNKSKKAIDKLMSIAKNDTDPVLRQSAIRSIYEIDSRLYLNFAEGTRQSLLHPEPRLFTAPRVEVERLNEQLRDLNERMRFEFDGKKFEFNQHQLNELLERSRQMQERTRDLNEKLRLDFGGKVFEWNKQQWEQFQQKAREVQDRARVQIRELQEQLREQPRVYRYRDEQTPQPEQAPQPAAKPQRDGGQRVIKPVTGNAAAATR